MFDIEKMVAQQMRASEDKALSRFDRSAESRKPSADRSDTQIREAKMETEDGQQAPIASNSTGPNTPLDADKGKSRKASTELEADEIVGSLSEDVSAAREHVRGDPEAVVKVFLGGVIVPAQNLVEGVDGPTERAPDWRKPVERKAVESDQPVAEEKRDLPVLGSEAFKQAKAEALAAVQAEYVYWPGRSGFIQRALPTEIGPEKHQDFDRIIGSKYGFWFTNKGDGKPRRYVPGSNELLSAHFDENEAGLDVIEGVEAAPGKDNVFVQRTRFGWRRLLNTWVEPERSSVANPMARWLFEDHVRYLCNGDAAVAGHLLDWIAHLVQRPGERVNHAILLVSAAQGTGKSALGNLVAKLAGAGNAANVEPGMLKVRFNGTYAGKTAIVVHEIYEDGNFTLANSLKSKITEERMPVDVKYGRQYDVANFARWLMLSNNEAPLALSKDDRRFFAINCRQSPKDSTYYERWFSEVDTPEGVEGVRRWLLTRDLSRFKSKAPPPMTEAKQAVIEASENPLEDYVRTRLADGWLLDRLGCGVSEDGEFSFAALKDVFKTTSVEAQARNTTALRTALMNVGFTSRRTSAGNRWRFPDWGGAGAYAGAKPGSSGDSGSETSSPQTAASKTKSGQGGGDRARSDHPGALRATEGLAGKSQ